MSFFYICKLCSFVLLLMLETLGFYNLEDHALYTWTIFLYFITYLSHIGSHALKLQVYYPFLVISICLFFNFIGIFTTLFSKFFNWKKIINFCCIFDFQNLFLVHCLFLFLWLFTDLLMNIFLEYLSYIFKGFYSFLLIHFLQVTFCTLAGFGFTLSHWRHFSNIWWSLSIMFKYELWKAVIKLIGCSVLSMYLTQSTQAFSIGNLKQ